MKKRKGILQALHGESKCISDTDLHGFYFCCLTACPGGTESDGG
jgi:hypothetical protein